MAKRKLNKRLIRRVIRHIEANPKRFDMSTWAVDNGGETPCGTTACIAGWAIILSSKDPKKFYRAARLDSADGSDRLATLLEGSSGAEVRGAKALGIPLDRWSKVFHAEFWPEPFASRWGRAVTDRYRVKVAKQRLEHLIETGE